MCQHHHGKGRVTQCLQHLFDAHKASQQLAFAGVLGVRQIEAATEVLACTAQHQQPRAIAGALLQRLQQRFGQTRIQGVGALRPV